MYSEKMSNFLIEVPWKPRKYKEQSADSFDGHPVCQDGKFGRIWRMFDKKKNIFELHI